MDNNRPGCQQHETNNFRGNAHEKILTAQRDEKQGADTKSVVLELMKISKKILKIFRNL